MRDTIKKTKRQATGWETIVANSISDKGLVSRTGKEVKSRRQAK